MLERAEGRRKLAKVTWKGEQESDLIELCRTEWSLGLILLVLGNHKIQSWNTVKPQFLNIPHLEKFVSQRSCSWKNVLKKSCWTKLQFSTWLSIHADTVFLMGKKWYGFQTNHFSNSLLEWTKFENQGCTVFP